MPYNPDHPALREQVGVAELEQYLTLEQCDRLIQLYEAGWRMLDGLPQLEVGGNLRVQAHRFAGEKLYVTISSQGQMIGRREVPRA
jgi:hypothetical protein